MQQPVLLIHGIAMRREQKVDEYAQALESQLGGGYRLLPIFWGDLGADDTYLHKVIGRHDSRSDGFWEMLQDSLVRPVMRGSGKARAWVETQRGEHRRSEAISERSRRVSSSARRRVRGYLGDKFQDARLWLTQQSLPFTADVIVYQSHSYRQKIQQRIREVIDRELGQDVGRSGSPVKVIAHSLGGVAAFDMAQLAEDPLHIDTFVTLGSQPALFHLLDPREGLAAYEEDKPVTLPDTIAHWTNVWDEYDLLAFAAGEVFRLHDGQRPIDIAVRTTRSRLKGAAMMRSHLRYFGSRDTGKIVRAALDGSEINE